MSSFARFSWSLVPIRDPQADQRNILLNILKNDIYFQSSIWVSFSRSDSSSNILFVNQIEVLGSDPNFFQSTFYGIKQHESATLRLRIFRL
jgi:hypothetical protein